ncbi:MAG TPA: ABC transporter permease [Trebonia sp.]
MTEPVSPPLGQAGTPVAGAEAAAPAAPPVITRPPWSLADIIRRFAVIGIWVLLAAAFAAATPLFLRQGTVQIIFGANGELVFLCLAALCPFCVGEFDFSIASVMGLSGTATAVMYTTHHWNVAAAALFALLLAVAAGSFNGFVVVVLGVNPIITTLAVATLLEGVALWMTNLTAVSGLPSSFGDIATQHVLGLPLFFWYGAALTLVFAYVLHGTPLGRHMTFVGANREVARLAGVRVNRIRFGSFVFSGLISGLAGVLLAANVGGYDPSSSAESLLPALAATFLGSAILIPGRLNPIGAWIAVFFLETGIVGLQLLGLTGWISDVFFGGSLVVAVMISTFLLRRRGGTAAL